MNVQKTQSLPRLSKTRETWRQMRESWIAYALIAPFMICFCIFIVGPVLSATLLSFTSYDSIRAPAFTGLNNFIKMFTKDVVLMKYVIPNTLLFAVVVGPVGYAMQFGLAWMINKAPKRLKKPYIMAIYAPSIAGGVLISVVWQVFFSSDRLGYLLWGEFPNWGLDESNPAALLSILPEWLTELERDYNHPSVVGWCPFNETGERRNKDLFRVMYQATRDFDPMRPIIDTSGYVHVITDIYDVHNYDQNPETFAKAFEALITGEGQPFVNNPRHEKYEGQPYFVSEFGGTYWNIDEDPSAAWGYGQAPKSLDEFYARFEGLINVLLDNPKMCAFCYTQLTDVYQEKNGIYAFDRRIKFDLDKLHAIMSRKAAIEK